MTPDVPAVLADLAGLLVRNAAPDTPDAERASSLGLAAALLTVAAEVWDGAAQRLMEENRTIRRLLADGAALTDDPDLAQFANRADQDLRLSILQAANAQLRAALVRLHAQMEAREDEQARALDEAIWAELRASTERRKLSVSLV
jgi:hypothetical protein